MEKCNAIINSTDWKTFIHLISVAFFISAFVPSALFLSGMQVQGNVSISATNLKVQSIRVQF